MSSTNQGHVPPQPRRHDLEGLGDDVDDQRAVRAAGYHERVAAVELS